MGELAKHQMAANWSNEMEDHLPWLEREDREQFLEYVLALVVAEWSDEKLAYHLVDEHIFPDALAAKILREFKERYGDD